jgi:PAS domain-containing protein
MPYIDSIVIISLCALIGVSVLFRFGRRRSNVTSSPATAITSQKNNTGGQHHQEAVLLFENGHLIDCNAAARQNWVPNSIDTSWQSTTAQLRHVFSDLPTREDHIQTSIICVNADNGRSLRVVRNGRHLRFVVDPEVIDEDISPNSPPRSVSQRVVDLAPFPVWHTDENNQVLWFNRAYGTLANRLGASSGASAEDKTIKELPFTDSDSGQFDHDGQRRLSVFVPSDNQNLWFDVTSTALARGQVKYATDVSAVVEAEFAQRNFIQTLAKTFAQLPIGLAIFDRTRSLALYNPALIDLMSIPTSFLSARPDLHAFFDRLRDSNMMPEPKSYSDWREQIDDLVQAASDDRYSETWSIPSGTVLSVTGRPHPDGAVAFLFQDITAEVTLTRRFRSELEIAQSVLDKLDDGVVVFAADGRVIQSNHSYKREWLRSNAKIGAPENILDTLQIWQTRCVPNPNWADVRDFVSTRNERSDWSFAAETKKGKGYCCHVHPVNSGATLVRFERDHAAVPALPQSVL